MSHEQQPPIRLAELVAALSLAADLGTGQPMEHALRTCLLSMGIGEALGLGQEQLADVYYLALLRFVGCTAGSHEAAVFAGGDDIAFYADMAPVFMGEPREMLGHIIRHLGEGQSPWRRARLIAAALGDRDGSATAIAMHCEAAQMLAQRMGIGEAVCLALGHAFERWDGKGLPGKLAGDAIPAAVRIVMLARDAELWCRAGGLQVAREILRQRRGHAYDPSVVDVFASQGDRLLAEIDGLSPWEAVLAAEPRPWSLLHDNQLDAALSAFADFADLKSPFTHGHSSGVADLVEGAARSLDMTEAEGKLVWRAALLHDLGRIGVPNGIWDKPGPLAAGEWERVRLHPYIGERILSRCAALAPVAAVAATDHERLDGSGYHRGSAAALLSPSARLLAAADAYQAMTQERPHRPALSAPAAAETLRRDAAASVFDQRIVQVVLEVAGQAHRSARRTWPAGLTDREVEVLQLAGRGYSNREIARRLSISPRTAGHHVEHIYEKIGVATRAGAALFAMEHRLLEP